MTTSSTRADRYRVVVAAGTARPPSPDVVVVPHRWTDGGVSVEAPFTGAHLLHLAVAGCVLNDVYREAGSLGIDVAGVRVTAEGGFAVDTWASTGITYTVDVDSPADARTLARLLARVDEVAEIPRAVRHGAPVRRLP